MKCLHRFCGWWLLQFSLIYLGTAGLLQSCKFVSVWELQVYSFASLFLFGTGVQFWLLALCLYRFSVMFEFDNKFGICCSCSLVL